MSSANPLNAKNCSRQYFDYEMPNLIYPDKKKEKNNICFNFSLHFTYLDKSFVIFAPRHKVLWS